MWAVLTTRIYCMQMCWVQGVMCEFVLLLMFSPRLSPWSSAAAYLSDRHIRLATEHWLWKTHEPSINIYINTVIEHQSILISGRANGNYKWNTYACIHLLESAYVCIPLYGNMFISPCMGILVLFYENNTYFYNENWYHNTLWNFQ